MCSLSTQFLAQLFLAEQRDDQGGVVYPVSSEAKVLFRGNTLNGCRTGGTRFHLFAYIGGSTRVTVIELCRSWGLYRSLLVVGFGREQRFNCHKDTHHYTQDSQPIDVCA